MTRVHYETWAFNDILFTYFMSDQSNGGLKVKFSKGSGTFVFSVVRVFSK